MENNNSIPPYLLTPPSGEVNPPIETRQQELPLGELTWEDFEKLCLRLIRLEPDVEHSKIYGKKGEKQEGIDIYARIKSSLKYKVYQCKRVKEFGASNIREAVEKFISGNWIDKTDTFILCTSNKLDSTSHTDEIELQSNKLKEKDIKILPWDSDILSSKLKALPEVVDDFFGRQWVKLFNGEEEAEKLGQRLDAQQVAKFRKEFAEFYKNVFNTHDPGLPIITDDIRIPLPIEQRYVTPDISDWQATPITFIENEYRKDYKTCNDQNNNVSPEIIGINNREQQTSIYAYKQRQSIENWLYLKNRNIILGDPGSGKSTLLRFIVIDLLKEEPSLTLLAQKWGQYLPIWIPFALWTKLISQENISYTCSLSNFLQHWLKSWNEEKLWPLIEKSLEDKRLLLLIDGLDEWTNEAAAKIALERLNVFIERRNLPVIVTSRPYGFKKIGFQQIGWEIGELRELTVKQQKQLSYIWFLCKTKILLENKDKDSIKQKAEYETTIFFNELSRTAELKELSKIPLILCLLIWHKIRDVRLPQNRFKAYETLIDYLISKHPKRRKSVAFITDDSSELNGKELKLVFSHLAYHIQEHFPEGLIETEKAIEITEVYLRGGSFDFNQRDANRLSNELLKLGENDIGLIVKKSPEEISFFHKMFQDFMTACYLSRMDLDKQLDIIYLNCSEPQWKEIFLGLFHNTKKEDDIKKFVEKIQEKSNITNIIEKYNINLLLSEIAFGEFNCPAKLVKELAEETFKEIETGDWMPHREQLLNIVIDGLRSNKVKSIVEEKIKYWFPSRLRYRGNIFDAMSKWTKNEELINCLIKNIYNEKVSNQRAAAKALVKLTTGDSVVAERIANIAQKAIEPDVRAIAIEALINGWPEHKDLHDIIEKNKDSLHPELRLISIIGKIKLNIHTEEERNILLSLGSSDDGVDYYWMDDVALALMEGWPKSPEIKRICLSALPYLIREAGKLHPEIALKILLEGYPQDKDVVEYLIREFKENDHRFSVFSQNIYKVWDSLSKNFQNIQPLIEVIDEWIFNDKDIYDIAMATSLSKSRKIKEKLLTFLHSGIIGPSVKALIEEWGADDIEFADKIIEIAWGDNSKAIRIAHCLPQIIKDKEKCKERLIELLKDISCNGSYFILLGMSQLDNIKDDTNIVNIFFDFIINRNNEWRAGIYDTFGLLIALFPSNPRVKKLAEEELQKHNGNITAVASVYPNDKEINRKIISMVNPLTSNLRMIIAHRLEEGCGDDNFAIPLLKYYDYEEEGHVKTQTSISYYSRLKAKEEDTNNELKVLSKNISICGSDYKVRRQAAFCGLVILKRLDIISELNDTIDADHYDISLEGFTPNIPLFNLILDNWDYIKTTLKENFNKILFGDSPFYDDLYICDKFCPFTDEYELPRNEFLNMLRVSTERKASINILKFLSRVNPKDQLLLNYCLDILCDRENTDKYSRHDLQLTAAEILGTNFAGDKNVLQALTQKILINYLTNINFNVSNVLISSIIGCKHLYFHKIYIVAIPSEQIIIALCKGWEDSQELNNICKSLSETEAKISEIAYTYLICHKGKSEIIFEDLLNIISETTFCSQGYSKIIISPFVKRISKDEKLFNILLNHLLKNPTPSEKSTIAKFIINSKGIFDEIKKFCIEEIDKQIKNTEPPEIGFDLFYGRVRPVIYSLLEALYQ